MISSTSYELGEHLEQIIASEAASDRRNNRGEDSPRLDEVDEQKQLNLIKALIDGEKSGPSTRLDLEAIRRKAMESLNKEP